MRLAGHGHMLDEVHAEDVPGVGGGVAITVCGSALLTLGCAAYFAIAPFLGAPVIDYERAAHTALHFAPPLTNQFFGHP